tara:strand:- start:381 stop:611 length:231 start_codon:yes stop_codon:yes gene_type:complete
MIVQDSSKNSLELSRKEALKVELRLNISEYGNLWSELGDTLYEYAIEKSTPKIMSVSKFQFIVLKSFYNELFNEPH